MNRLNVRALLALILALLMVGPMPATAQQSSQPQQQTRTAEQTAAFLELEASLRALQFGEKMSGPDYKAAMVRHQKAFLASMAAYHMQGEPIQARFEGLIKELEALKAPTFESVNALVAHWFPKLDTTSPQTDQPRSTTVPARSDPVEVQAVPIPQPVPTPAPQPLQRQEYDIPRLLTIWDRIEKEFTPNQMAALKTDDKDLKTPNDVVALFSKHYPRANEVTGDPKYKDPADLVPARNADDPMYSKFQQFRRWRTNPVGPEVKDLNDLRAHRKDVLSDIENTPLEKGGLEDVVNVKATWKRRTDLALDFNWPWALGIAKLDVLSPVHKEGNYKKDGVYHVEKGILNRLTGADATQPVLRLWLPEVSQIVELAFKCRNGFIVQLEAPLFQSVSTLPVCTAVKGQPTKFTSDSQSGYYEAVLDEDVEVRNELWKLRNSHNMGNATSVTVLGSDILGSPEVNRLEYTVEARKKGQVDGKWYPVSCFIDLTKELPTLVTIAPPPPPPVPHLTNVPPTNRPPVNRPPPEHKARCGTLCKILIVAAIGAAVTGGAKIAVGGKNKPSTPPAAVKPPDRGCSQIDPKTGACIG